MHKFGGHSSGSIKVSSSSNNTFGNDGIHLFSSGSTLSIGDSTNYTLLELFFNVIFIIAAAGVYIYKYQPDVIDPINGVKSFYINTYIITVVAMLVLWLILYSINAMKKYSRGLLIIFLIFSFIILFVFVGMRLHYDNIYNERFFHYEYSLINGEESANKATSTELILKGLTLTTESKEDHYVSECMRAFSVFQIKTYLLMGVHIGINVIAWGFLAKEYIVKQKQREIKER